MGVGFEQLIGRSPTRCAAANSSGWRSARCIVREPLIFLMDEPI